MDDARADPPPELHGVLLTAALILMTIVHQFPFVNAWLTMKLSLLLVYVVLGSVAHTHKPLGAFSLY